MRLVQTFRSGSRSSEIWAIAMPALSLHCQVTWSISRNRGSITWDPCSTTRLWSMCLTALGCPLEHELIATLIGFTLRNLRVVHLRSRFRARAKLQYGKPQQQTRGSQHSASQRTKERSSSGRGEHQGICASFHEFREVCSRRRMMVRATGTERLDRVVLGSLSQVTWPRISTAVWLIRMRERRGSMPRLRSPAASPHRRPVYAPTRTRAQ
jgi:hypothetical protein